MWKSGTRLVALYSQLNQGHKDYDDNDDKGCYYVRVTRTTNWHSDFFDNDCYNNDNDIE